MRIIVLTALLMSGCASLNTTLPGVSDAMVKAEQQAQEKQAFDEIGRLRARLDRVASKVLQANADMCEKTALDPAFKTQTIKSFPKELRAGARRELGLSDEPIIVYVRPGSAAAIAGLKAGDILQNEEGETLSAKAVSGLMKEDASINRVRGGEVSKVTMTGPQMCSYPAGLKMSSVINAYANGKAIIVTAGMMNFVKSDDELAYIIGHELAHNTQSHIRKSITNYVLSLGGTRYTRPFESEADYVGLYYMERAGFDASGVEDMWRRLARLSIRPIGRAKTHPAYPSRAVQIQATRDEINTKRKGGAALQPEFKKDQHD